MRSPSALVCAYFVFAVMCFVVNTSAIDLQGTLVSSLKRNIMYRVVRWHYMTIDSNYCCPYCNVGPASCAKCCPNLYGSYNEAKSVVRAIVLFYGIKFALYSVTWLTARCISVNCELLLEMFHHRPKLCSTAYENALILAFSWGNQNLVSRFRMSWEKKGCLSVNSPELISGLGLGLAMLLVVSVRS